MRMKTNKIFLLAAVIFLLALGIQAMRPEVSAEESKNTRLTMADDTATPTPGGMVVLGPEATPDPTPNGEVVIVPGVTPEPTPGGEIVPPDSTAVPEPTIDPETRPDPEAVSLGAVSLSIHPAEVVPLVVGGCVTGAGCEIRMSSSDLSVASVNEKGMVRGENPGTAVITVQVLWIGEAVKEMTCEVTVTSKKIPYKKLRKKLRAQRGSKMMFADEGSSASSLTLYDGLYWVFKVHPGDYTYGSGDETIFCYPKIVVV